MAADDESVVFTITRPEVTGVVTRGAAKLFLALGYSPLAEVTLPNGRRADLMAIGPRGQIAIAEVKSGLEDYRTDKKWAEYAPYCDAFYFAVDADFPRQILPLGPGLIVADGFGGAVIVEAPVTPLASSRRRALTLAFARLAAARALAF
ncbi:MAG TPA: DNA repair putative endonuclease MmcB [Caulobacteraceae bacterium]|nr:DNA repair putative endonuclease MmcB [Caulobacteraceae bacterium]